MADTLMKLASKEMIKPVAKPKVMHLVRDAGLDISDWADHSGPPASNPRFCYEWCYEQEGLLVFNIWYHEIEYEDGEFPLKLNMRQISAEESGPRSGRARRFDEAARRAYELRSPARVLVLDRPTGSNGSATARLLDRAPWVVTDYEYGSGEFTLRRGLHNRTENGSGEIQCDEHIEGHLVWSLTRHRRREASLRDQKIRQCQEETGVRLICQVKDCGFDFEEVYGEVGRGYAQVHHLVPLSSFDEEGGRVTLDDLAIVCANCHAMIHRGGDCRDMRSLIQRRT